ncbi:protein PIF-like [Mercenaria mercenaria]|uniref:protein PIF-like n=1 Tax=Mercenaria mercenaria TaxID=6596 RepID=UPI00234F8EF7|nr:protein PIF-like [Mercenaria mercenaria]
MYAAILTIIAMLYATNAQSLDELCTMNKWLRGASYFEHPTDCEKFVQCHRNALGRLVAEEQQCSFPTYWKTELLTCVPVQEIMCANDKCAVLPDGSVRGGYRNCRGYWECQDGKSEPKCCPLGQKFDDDFGCVETKDEDDECKDTCMGIVYEPKNETLNETVVCPKLAIAGEPGYYKQYEEGWGLRKFPCSPGTVFDQDMCECVRAAAPVEKAKCKPEVHLTFTNNQTVINGYFVENENVIVQNGVADFNGVNSRLNIPRFNNIEHSEAIVIRIKYTSSQEKTGYPQAVLSNSGCGFLPSIIISEDEHAVTFGVGTTRNLLASTSVKQPKDILSTEKTVELKFLNGVLMGSVNNVASAVPANGYLRNVQCTLNVGFAENMSHFKGKVDELSVFMCDPDMP